MWILFTHCVRRIANAAAAAGVALPRYRRSLMPPGPPSLIIDGIIGGVGGVIVFR